MLVKFIFSADITSPSLPPRVAPTNQPNVPLIRIEDMHYEQGQDQEDVEKDWNEDQKRESGSG